MIIEDWNVPEFTNKMNRRPDFGNGDNSLPRRPTFAGRGGKRRVPQWPRSKLSSDPTFSHSDALRTPETYLRVAPGRDAGWAMMTFCERLEVIPLGGQLVHDGLHW